MTENRFADCETVHHVLRAALPVEPPELWDAIEADALARIRELTPPVVSEEARERARRAARKWWNEPTSVNADALADRIIDALGYTPTSSEQLAAMTAEAADDDGYASVNGFVDTRPAPPPVVDLAPDELRWLAAVVEDYEKLYNDASRVVDIDTLPPSLELRLVDAGLPAKVVCGENCWVLRIGGDQ